KGLPSPAASGLNEAAVFSFPGSAWGRTTARLCLATGLPQKASCSRPGRRPRGRASPTCVPRQSLGTRRNTTGTITMTRGAHALFVFLLSSLCSLCLCGESLRAEAPVASYIFPAGGQRGKSVDFRVGGLFLYQSCGFEMLGPGVTAGTQLRRTKTTWFEGPLL